MYPWILCGTGPMQNEWHVKFAGKVLHRFTCYEAAEAYRVWVQAAGIDWVFVRKEQNP